jgi:hypothetical protein
LLVLRSLGAWTVIILAEVIHGTARVMFLQPYVGDFRARQIAVFTGSAIIIAIVVGLIRWIRATSTAQLFAVGLMWLALTLAFELLLGRFVFGYSWERLASDFNLLEGSLLPIGLLVLMLSPIIAAKIRS